MSITEALAEELDEGWLPVLHKLRAKAFYIYCQKGCTACCAVLVVSYLPEALRIAAYLNQPEHTADAKAAFWPRIRDGKSRRAMSLSGRLRHLSKAGKQNMTRCILNTSAGPSPVPFWSMGPVASTRSGRWAAAMPMHRYRRSVRRRSSGGRPPAAVDFVPLTRLIHRATQLLHAVHNVKSRQRHGQQSVCVAVYELLTRPARR